MTELGTNKDAIANYIFYGLDSIFDGEDGNVLNSARLAFIRLYPVPLDFDTFDDLLACLEDTKDEKNPLHWLERVADGTEGKREYVALCERYIQAVVLISDKWKRGERFPLSEKYGPQKNCKPRTTRDGSAPYDEKLSLTKLWGVDGYENCKGSKAFFVGCEVSMFKMLGEKDLHMYDCIQTSKNNTGGDKPTMLFFDIDADKVTDKIVWKRTLEVCFNKIVKALEKKDVVLLPEMMMVLSSHDRGQGKLSYHLLFPMAPVIFESVADHDAFVKANTDILELSLADFGVPEGTVIPKFDLGIYNDRNFRMLNQTKWKSNNHRTLDLKNYKWDELAFLAFDLHLIQQERKYDTQFFLVTKNVESIPTKRRKKTKPAVSEVVYDDNVRDTMINWLKNLPHPQFKNMKYGQLLKHENFYVLKIRARNNYCPVADGPISSDQNAQACHNPSLLFTRSKWKLQCWGNCHNVEGHYPISLKCVLFESLQTDECLVYYQEGVSLYDFMRIDPHESMHALTEKLKKSESWIQLRYLAEIAQDEQCFLARMKQKQKYVDGDLDGDLKDIFHEVRNRDHWRERRIAIQDRILTVGHVIKKLHQNDLYTLMKCLSNKYPQAWEFIWDELSVNQLYTRYVVCVVEAEGFIRVDDTVSQWNAEKKCYVNDWAGDESDIKAFLLWVNLKNPKIAGVYGRISKDLKNIIELVKEKWPSTVIEMRYYGYRNGIYDRDTRIFYAYENFDAIDSARAKQYKGQKWICYQYYDQDFVQAANPTPVEIDCPPEIAIKPSPFDLEFHDCITIVDVILLAQELSPCDIVFVYACLGRAMFKLKQRDLGKFFLYFLGESNTGKSVLLKLMELFHREEYVMNFGAKVHEKVGFDYEGFNLCVHSEMYETQMAPAQFKQLIEGERTSKTVLYKGDKKYTPHAPTVGAGNPRGDGVKLFKYMPDEKGAVSNRTAVVPFKIIIDENISKELNVRLFPDLKQEVSKELVNWMFDEIDTKCRHMPVIMERALFCYELFCREMKKVSFWYELLPSNSKISQTRKSNSLIMLAAFLKEFFVVNDKVTIKALRVLKKSSTQIAIDKADVEKFGLNYRGKPENNTKCGSLHFQDFSEAYKLYSKSRGKPDRLGRLSFSDLLHILWEKDILLKRIDFSDTYKGKTEYECRKNACDAERLNWVMFGIVAKETQTNYDRTTKKRIRRHAGELKMLKSDGDLFCS